MAPMRLTASTPNRERKNVSGTRVEPITYALATATAHNVVGDPPEATRLEMIPTVRATHWPITTARWTRDSQGAGVSSIFQGYCRIT